MSCISRLYAAIVLTLALCAGCSKAPPPAIDAALDESGLHLKLNPPAALDALELRTGDGIVVQSWQKLPKQGSLDLPVRVRRGHRYELQAVVRGVALPLIQLSLPRPSETPVKLTLQRFGDPDVQVLIPNGAEQPRISLPQGESRILLEMTHESDSAGTATLIFPASLQATDHGDRSKVKPILFEWRGQSTSENFPIVLRDKPLTLPLVVRYEPQEGPGMREWALEITFEPLDPETVAGWLSIPRIVVPAPPPGGPPQPAVSGVVRLPDPWWNQLSRLLGLPVMKLHPDTPYAHIGVTLANSGHRPVPAVVDLLINSREDAAPARDFAPAEWRASSGSGPQVRRLVTVPPGESQVLLPLYVRPEVRAGTYQMNLEVWLLGSSVLLAQSAEPLHLRTPLPAVTLTLLITVLVALITLPLAVHCLPVMLTSLEPRQIMFCALLAALLFCGHTVMGALNQFLTIFLGPFNIFAGELFNEVWTAGCMVCLLGLIPRPGVFALLYLIQALMRGLLWGQLGLADLLITGSAIGLAEGLLFVSGYTRPVARSWPLTLQGAALLLALAMADALSTWIQLAMGMGLYRLHYAAWYLGAAVLLTGFVYTALGAWWTWPLVRQLRRLHG